MRNSEYKSSPRIGTARCDVFRNDGHIRKQPRITFSGPLLVRRSREHDQLDTSQTFDKGSFGQHSLVQHYPTDLNYFASTTCMDLQAAGEQQNPRRRLQCRGVFCPRVFRNEPNSGLPRRGLVKRMNRVCWVTAFCAEVKLILSMGLWKHILTFQSIQAYSLRRRP